MFELPRPKEIEFRDGRRLVPEYLGVIMDGLETHRMTYEEALLEANRRMEANFLNAQQDSILAAHFRERR